MNNEETSDEIYRIGNAIIKASQTHDKYMMLAIIKTEIKKARQEGYKEGYAIGWAKGMGTKLGAYIAKEILRDVKNNE